jgi:hypothetical protein
VRLNGPSRVKRGGEILIAARRGGRYSGETDLEKSRFFPRTVNVHDPNGNPSRLPDIPASQSANCVSTVLNRLGRGPMYRHPS